MAEKVPEAITLEQQYHCSFCSKDRNQVQQLIAGLDQVRVCDECVTISSEIIAQKLEYVEKKRAASESATVQNMTMAAEKVPEVVTYDLQCHCSFCRKSRKQVQWLIAGPDQVCICDECVTFCNEIIAEELEKSAASAKYVEAERFYQRALAIREQWLGAKLLDMAKCLNNLAGLYYQQRRYVEAEPLYQRVLMIREQQLGTKHLDTARCLNNLASLYEKLGRYEVAEPLYQRVLTIYKQRLGATHPSTATSLYNLAGLNETQGKYVEAELLCQRALAIRKRRLGITHPSYEEAELLYRRVLAIRERQLEAEHLDMEFSFYNLASLYEKFGEYEEAEPLYQRALTIYEQQLGTEHPNTAYPLNGLAILYQKQGKYEEAEPLYRRALTIREQQLGADHPDTVKSLNLLMGLYKLQGRYAEAEPLCQRILAITEQQLGAEHLDTASSLNFLAWLYYQQMKYGEAEPLYRRALTIREQQLGADHPDVATSLNCLALLYHHQMNYREAEPLYRRALTIQEQKLGADHPDTATSLRNLAWLCYQQKKYEEAELLYQRVLSIWDQQLEDEHLDAATNLNNLTGFYSDRESDDKGEHNARIHASSQLGSHPRTDHPQVRHFQFTERARKVLSLAQKEAQRFQHNYVGTGHLLLGLILSLAQEENQRFRHNYIGGEYLLLEFVRGCEGVTAKVLTDRGVELNKVRCAVEFTAGRGNRTVSCEVGLTPQSKKVIEIAAEEARRSKSPYVGIEHLLLGLVREDEGIATHVFESLGVDREGVRLAVGVRLAIFHIKFGIKRPWSMKHLPSRTISSSVTTQAPPQTIQESNQSDVLHEHAAKPSKISTTAQVSIDRIAARAGTFDPITNHPQEIERVNQPSHPPLWNIPYKRNTFFTGQEEVLSQLYRALHAENTVALSQPQGISGLGGIGKTQTALEYAYRYGTEYDAVFWVHAVSTLTLISSLVGLAQVLELPERNEQDQNIIVAAVQQWLLLHSGWLLIFDNMDDLSVAEAYLPKAGPGHLLFTTRARALSGIAQRLEMQTMEPEIGGLLLLRKAGILVPQATWDKATSDEQNIACEISRELDGLPLALDQAGAYIRELPCRLADYLRLYQIRRREVLQIRGSLDKDYPASVATTWSLSFEKVSRVNPAAADLLHFCAFLAPNAIPEEVITGGAQHLTPLLQRVAIHPVQYDHMVSSLLAYSLVERNEDDTLHVHRLVQAVLRDGMSVGAVHQWERRAVLAVNATSPNVHDVKQWEACERWVPHAQVCADWIEHGQITEPEAIRLLIAAGYYLDDHARYSEAEPLYQRAVAICEQQIGVAHYMAQAMSNLATVYVHEGKYAKAEPLYKHALVICEQQWGANPETATCLINLAGVYGYQGRYREAEALYKKALSIRERRLGAAHPSTAQILNNLAALYETMGKYRAAEPLARRSLAICEQQLGADHPETARSLNNLAGPYEAQGRYAEAESLYQRALDIYEQQVGADHPETAQSLNNLAHLYERQGKYAEAEPLYRRAISIWKQRLGTDHPDTQTARENYAVLLRTMRCETGQGDQKRNSLHL